MDDEEAESLIMRYAKHRESFIEEEIEALFKLQHRIKTDQLILQLALGGEVKLGLSKDGKDVMVIAC